MSFEGVSSDLFIRDPLTKEAARVRDNSLQVVGAFFSIQEKYTGNNTVGQQFLLSHTPVLTNVIVEITADGINWTGFTSFTVAGQVVTTSAAVPASPANNVRITYFIAKINTVAVVTSPSLDQQVAQLSQIEINTNLVSPNVAFEVGQLSTIISELQGLSVTIGDVNVNTDQLEELTRLFQASNADGLTNVILSSVEGFTNIYLLLGQEVSQLSQLMTNTSTGVVIYQTVNQLSIVGAQLSHEIEQLSTLELYGSQMVGQLTQVELAQGGQSILLAQEVAQLSDLQTRLATEVTQLSVLQELKGLSIDIGTINVNTDELETLARLQISTTAVGFTNTDIILAQEVGQLSQIITNTGLAQIDVRPLLVQEIIQLSTLELYGSQQVNQLSNLNAAVVLEIAQLTTIGLYEYEQVAQLTSIDARLSNVVTQLTTIELYTFQEVGQLSQIITNTSGEAGEIPLLSQQVTQLSTKIAQESQMISQLTTIEFYSSQQVDQLSNTYTVLNGISIVDGRVLISSQPPDAPPSTTSVIRSAQSVMGGTADTVYTITNAKILTILRFRGGAAVGGAGSKIEIYYDPNGTGVGMTLIDTGYASGNNFIFDESSSQTYTGNGTRAIRMRRTRFGAGTLEIYGRWDGYEL